jgi:hypothetical protein
MNLHRTSITAATAALVVGLLAWAGPATANGNQQGTPTTDVVETTTSASGVTVSGGFGLAPVDKGRPSFLYDGILGVPHGTWRKAFAGVVPSKDGPPTQAEEETNKKAIMSVLAPYGITDAQVNRVADYYRFDKQAGDTWPHRAATVEAVVTKGKVTGFTIVDPGVGYQTAPTITVAGHPKLEIKVRLAFTTDFATNGHVASVRLVRR